MSSADRPETLPVLTILIPTRNEADFIERCLRALLENDYPAEKMEILILDGASDDDTRNIVERLAAEDPRIVLLDNPHRIISHAVNLGVARSKGDIIVRVDGHALVAPDFLRQSAAALAAHPEAWCVGGPLVTESPTFVGRTIAGATSSPIGVGNAQFRLGNHEGPVDTIAFGAYHRWVFDRIGGFDEELVRNQDDHFNHRIIRAGGIIYMTPRIQSRYYARSSFRMLARQYYQFGFWRIRTLQKQDQLPAFRQIVPLLFVMTWAALLGLTALWWPGRYALAAFGAAYAFGLLLGTVDLARRMGISSALLAPLAFAILHFGYGFGSVVGLVRFTLLRHRRTIPVEDYPLSR